MNGSTNYSPLSHQGRVKDACAGRPGFWHRLHRCERGQAIFVIVLFFLLMAGLLFLVINTGQQLNHKVEMQNAADAVSAGGAAWFARGLNVISMANVTNTQLLSMIVLCDTMESVSTPAQECIDELMSNISSSKAGHDFPLDDRFSDWLIVGNAASEQQIIRMFGGIVQAVNWSEYLTYDTGVLWECAKLMDGFSHAMAEITPLAAQREAIDIAKRDFAAVGFILPLWPALPVVEGQWTDFMDPMRFGRLPPPNPDGTPAGGFAVMAYHNYNNALVGPFQYWREPLTEARPMGLFDISRFSVLFNIVSQRKFEMMFGSADDRVSLRDWEMDYDKAKGLSNIRRSWWESLHFDARYPLANDDVEPWSPEGGAAIVKPFPPPPTGTWDIRRNPKNPDPRLRSYGGGAEPRLSGYTRATQSYDGADPREALWYRVTERKTAHYPQIGIYAPHAPTHPDGSTWPYTPAEMKTYYSVQFWRFDGAELETDESLHRRYVGPGSVAMSPILLDQVDGDNTTLAKDRRFTFTGFAYRSGQVQDWQTRFINPNPVEDLVAYAQSRVYGHAWRYDSSSALWNYYGFGWDTFTQNWRAKLMRADRWKTLLTELDKSIPSQGQEIAGKLTPERLEPVRKVLEGYNDPFVKEVTH